MKQLVIFASLLFFAAESKADFILNPATLSPGGVALLCWQGTSSAPILEKVRFANVDMPLLMRESHPCAIVGVDIEQNAGLWPLTVESRGPLGELHVTQLSLRIEAVERPAQRLTLPKQMVTPTDNKIVKQIERDVKRLDQIFSCTQAEIFSPPFQRPLNGEVISAFGLRRILNGISKSPHNGIDFRATRGTPVTAMTRGQVVLAENLYYTGKTVILDHGGGLFSLYAHLDSFSVSSGKIVERGDVVGQVGSTGRSTAPHLHMGTRLGKIRIDPLALIALFSDEKEKN